MAQISVTIDGKQFRMACEDGQEAHLLALAADVDGRIKSMRQSFGDIGDLRLAVMAGLMLADEVNEERRKAAAVQCQRQPEPVGKARRGMGPCAYIARRGCGMRQVIRIPRGLIDP